MAVSQLTIYQSSDASAPVLTGENGKMIDVLDACLVNGYGSKVAAGWSKPLANSGNCGCWKNGTGSSQLNLYLNDSGANGSALAREAYAFGFETISGLGGFGVGTGQFPSPAVYSGWRKSATLDTTPRYWMVVADAHTCYVFILTGDAAANYGWWTFGDIYSYKQTPDAYRCIVTGMYVPNASPQNAGANHTGFMVGPASDAYALTVTLARFNGHYMARTMGGGGSAINVGLRGDAMFSYNLFAGSGGNYFQIYPIAGFGNATPNTSDGAIYLTPLEVFEPSNGAIRGWLRGIYHVCHPIGNFTDGQTFSGAGDYAGKTYQIVKSVHANSFIAFETSATVDYNT